MAETTLTKLLDILQYSTELLKSKNIDNARLNVELMLCDTLKCDRVKLYLDFEKPLTKEERDSFKIKLLRRINGEPLQYILGYTDFCDVKIFLNKDVLIPRPETEELVVKILDEIIKRTTEKFKIYEAATGSGCISIALGKALEKAGLDYEITASDISSEAIKTAKYNAEYNKVRNIKFENQDFLELNNIDKEYNVFVMNPPYVSKDEVQSLDHVILDWEPLIAVTDYEDGLKFYKKMFDMMKNRNLNAEFIFCEIGYNQKEKLQSLMESYRIGGYEFFKDLSGNDRILFIKNESGNTAG